MLTSPKPLEEKKASPAQLDSDIFRNLVLAINAALKKEDFEEALYMFYRLQVYINKLLEKFKEGKEIATQKGHKDFIVSDAQEKLKEMLGKQLSDVKVENPKAYDLLHEAIELSYAPLSTKVSDARDLPKLTEAQRQEENEWVILTLIRQGVRIFPAILEMRGYASLYQFNKDPGFDESVTAIRSLLSNFERLKIRLIDQEIDEKWLKYHLENIKYWHKKHGGTKHTIKGELLDPLIKNLNHPGGKYNAVQELKKILDAWIEQNAAKINYPKDATEDAKIVAAINYLNGNMKEHSFIRNIVCLLQDICKKLGLTTIPTAITINRSSYAELRVEGDGIAEFEFIHALILEFKTGFKGRPTDSMLQIESIFVKINNLLVMEMYSPGQAIAVLITQLEIIASQFKEKSEERVKLGKLMENIFNQFVIPDETEKKTEKGLSGIRLSMFKAAAKIRSNFVSIEGIKFLH